MVGLLPVWQQLGSLFIVQPHIHVLEMLREEVVNLTGHVEDVGDPERSDGEQAGLSDMPSYVAASNALTAFFIFFALPSLPSHSTPLCVSVEFKPTVKIHYDWKTHLEYERWQC